MISPKKMNMGRAAKAQLLRLCHKAWAQILSTGMRVKSSRLIPAVARRDRAIHKPEVKKTTKQTRIVAKAIFMVEKLQGNINQLAACGGIPEAVE
jgi:hypothetical protein